MILNIKWQDKIRNEVWERAGQEPMNMSKKWRWIDHTLKKPNTYTSIARQALTWNPQGNKKNEGDLDLLGEEKL